MTEPIKAVIIDFKPVIDEFSKCGNMYWLYQRLPITDIISRILDDASITALILESIDLNEVIENEANIRDMEFLEIFYEDLMEKIFFLMFNKRNRRTKNLHLIFDRWIDQTSAIFINNGYINRN